MTRSILDVFGEVVYTLHILGNKFEGSGHRKQQLEIGNFLNPRTRLSVKEMSRNGQVWKVVRRHSK
jgi:hypothetical protein